MKLSKEQELILEMCESTLSLSNELGEEYRYNSIVFCLIDAIFSIGVRYESTKNTVIRYCDSLEIDRVHKNGEAPNDKHTIDDYLNYIHIVANDDYGREKILDNRQKTSTRNGIYKAEAVYKAAALLKSLDIQTISDIRKYEHIDNLEMKFKQIKGQKSGISFSYFLMLVGDDNYMKIDRWLLRFVEKAIGSKQNIDQTYNDLMAVCNILKKKHPQLTPRSFDYAIWSYSKNTLN